MSRPLDPFGAEIDVDLGAPLTTAQQDELRRLYATHDLLLARGQRLTMEDQVRVMEYLGPVLDTPDGRGGSATTTACTPPRSCSTRT